MKTLYIDMDGTLAEFRQSATMEDMYTLGYFEDLLPNENVVEAIRIFKEEHPEVKLSVLSCILPDRKRAKEEKINWLKKYCPFLLDGENYFIPCGMDKSVLIGDGDNFLLDDYSENLLLFEKKGHGIKLLNGINGKGLRWKGPRLDHTMAPKALSDMLFGTMERILQSA